MATIKTRRKADGKDAFRVVWRAGGTRDGAWESETFDAKGEFAQTYVRDLTGITPGTRHRYDRMVLHATAQLQAVLREQPTVPNATEAHVRRSVNAREAVGARPKTIADYHGLLYAVMAATARDELRARNPCTGTRLPDRYQPDAVGDGEAVFSPRRSSVCSPRRCSGSAAEGPGPSGSTTRRRGAPLGW